VFTAINPSNSDFNLKNGTVNKKTLLNLGANYRYDGSSLSNNLVAAGASTFGVTYAKTLDVSQITELSNGPALSLPTRAVNLGGTVTISNAFNLLTGATTQNTNQFAIASSGWTNTNAFNCTMFITGATAATFTYSDGTNAIFTDTGLTFTTSETLPMGPSYKVVVSSGTITGNAIVSH